MRKLLLFFVLLLLPSWAWAQTSIFTRMGPVIEPTITIGALTDGTARQSAETRLTVSADTLEMALEYAVTITIDTGGTITGIEDTEGVLIYAAYSPTSGAADNQCGTSGSDAAYTGYSSNLVASLAGCHLIYRMHLTETADTEHTETFTFRPALPYVVFIVYNNIDQTLGTTHDLDVYPLSSESQ